MKNIICNLSPFNNSEDMSTWEYVIKKLLAFVVLYCFAAVLGEGIIIGMLCGMGYDPLHGIMPTGVIGELLPYYGFIVFLLVTVIYCKFIEKRGMKSMGFSSKIADFFVGALLAVVLIVVIIGLSCVFDSMVFNGFSEKGNNVHLVRWLLAFVIQGVAEEVMCRGFLLQALLKKTSMSMAIIISSTAFAFPHFFTLFESELLYAIIGVVNLYLISIIFSLLVILRSNIWIAFGLHSIWNFVLYGIMGLSVSGSESKSEGLIQFCVKDANILNGAEYGMEASIIATLILALVVFGLAKIYKDRMGKNGI